MKKKKLSWLAILGLVVGGLFLLCILAIGGLVLFAPQLYASYENKINQSSLEVGSTAPDFELTALTGETVRLSQYLGQPVLLTFGATWCPDCRNELPIIEQVQEKYPDLVILLVDSGESADLVQTYVGNYGITHTVLLDPDETVSKQYKIFAIPTELFIDADGIIQAKIVESVTLEQVETALESIGVRP